MTGKFLIAQSMGWMQSPSFKVSDW